jgi:hypothetical protein
MKMMMRLDKSQVPRLHKFTSPGVHSWNRALAIMAGYKNFEAFVVGAAGGPAGTAVVAVVARTSISPGR